MAEQVSHGQAQRGALIVVEGLDRAGKSSQCEALREFLQESGQPVKYVRFPGGNPLFQSRSHEKIHFDLPTSQIEPRPLARSSTAI